MGSMTFLLPNPIPPAAEALLRQACFAGGYDQTPVPTTAAVVDGRLVVSRGPNESGYLFLPWPVGPVGAMVTTTSTLRERPEPYNLLLELARGKLNQIRGQTADWREIGLQTTPEFDREVEEVTRLFGTAVLNQPSGEADAAATRVLERSYRLADQLVRLYVGQMFATRHDEEGKLDTRLAARVAAPPAGGHAGDYHRAFNAARIGFRWRDVEPGEAQYNWSAVDQAMAAARAAGLPPTFGPVIDLSPGMLPVWAAGWAGDLATLAAFMCDYLETLIGRYRAQVRRWVVCAGFNHADGLGLADDERFRLVQRLFEAALQLDPELDLVLGIAQPWGDYLVHDDQTISPLSFADDLIRTGLRVSAVELDLRTGTKPRGSLPRDLLDASRVLDLFAHLGLPLEVVLGHPASGKPDPAAQEHNESVWSPGWRGAPTPEGQAEWGASFAALALCKPQVRAVTWDHWTDLDPHLTPAGGLINAAGRPNPLLARLQALRTAHLV
ncbi:MAG: hypothetical protein JWO38_835 [Gemmataceae bacterium]|nr:hypothetical protein [Gemmataceae bacterium]